MIVLIVRALAVWRLSHLFMYEAGPWRVVLDLRKHFGVRHDDNGTPYAWPEGSVFECFLCLSVWAGLAASSLPPLFLEPFALSALAIWAEKVHRGSQ